MKELLEHIARALVDEPEQVEVRLLEGERVDTLELRVAPKDIGKVIGRQGRIVKAIRAVVSAAAAKEKKRVLVEVIS
ncbi:MAG: KH domain-containing protein [Firmicutes bacterium]|nr:KH domain-containing protein [Bacillota bacterium]HPU01574.1 KH domain-containing protein [Bacillota bacterium]